VKCKSEQQQYSESEKCYTPSWTSKTGSKYSATNLNQTTNSLRAPSLLLLNLALEARIPQVRNHWIKTIQPYHQTGIHPDQKNSKTLTNHINRLPSRAQLRRIILIPHISQTTQHLTQQDRTQTQQQNLQQFMWALPIPHDNNDRHPLVKTKSIHTIPTTTSGKKYGVPTGKKTQYTPANTLDTTRNTKSIRPPFSRETAGRYGGQSTTSP